MQIAGKKHKLHKVFFVRFAAGLLLAAAALGSSGCAATMAAKQPGLKDLSVLQPGTPRGRVIAEIGPPLATHPTDRGGMDVFAFKQGYSRTNRTARALGHATGTFMTAGFWEIAGIPLESWFDGTDVKMEVYYGQLGEVESVTVYEGADAFQGRILGPHVQLASAPPLPSYTAQAPYVGPTVGAPPVSLDEPGMVALAPPENISLPPPPSSSP
jgi:hypothetical protein